MFKRTWKIRALLTLTLIAALLGTVASAWAAPYREDVTVILDFDRLPALGADYAYEGWLIVDGTPVSTGIFSANTTPTRFTVDVADPSEIQAFVLTIEPSPDDDPAPSSTHILGGDFVNGTASLGTEHGGALNNHFLQASGDYILNAPSGGDDAVYQNGIWWLIPEAGPGPSLDLPALPAGWVYEGWVVGPDGPMTTGRFTDLSGADSDGAGPTAGMGDFPPFPGQDFVNPAVDLIGYAAVISIEPEPDTSAAPFDLKPLLDSSIDDVGAGTPQAMMNNAETFPTGTATLVGMAADAGAETMEETETEAEPTILPASGAARLPATLVGGAVALVAGALLLGAGWIARKRSQ